MTKSALFVAAAAVGVAVAVLVAGVSLIETAEL